MLRKIIISALIIGYGIAILTLVFWVAHIEDRVSKMQIEKADKKQIAPIQDMVDRWSGVKEFPDAPGGAMQ